MSEVVQRSLFETPEVLGSVLAIDPWDAFTEFIVNELASGGPDPHMRYVGWMNKDEPQAERLWRAGLYMSVYNTATAEVLWRNLDPAWPEPILRAWLYENWPGIATRRERRTVRSADKLARCIVGYRAWLTKFEKEQLPFLPADPEQAYEAAWRYAQDIPFFGRYACFKLLEVFSHWCDVPIEMYDIRAAGGYSPRETLALLYPNEAHAIYPTSNEKEHLLATDRAAENCLLDLSERGLYLDYYTLEVFLCDFKQSYVGKRQYPGRSTDSEMDYYTKILPHWRDSTWPHETLLWKARGALNPEWARGERNGWNGVRKELGRTLAEEGYTWSDAKYRYKNPMDLGNPERREGALSDADLHYLGQKGLTAWTNLADPRPK